MMNRSTPFARRVLLATLSAATFLAVAAPAVAQKPFKVVARWNTGGEGGWDYLTVDSSAHRLYIAHSARVDVLDLNTGKVIGTVTGLSRTHGVIVAPDGKTAFVSDGGANSVVAFDTTSFAAIAKIPTGTNPDGMVLEPATNTLWAFNGGSRNATVISIADRKVVGTVALPGRPEFPAADGSGTIFLNLEDKNSISRIDAKSMKVTATWPLAGCAAPSGLAFDAAGSRLFSVCDGKKMAITDAKTGKQLGLAAVGEGPDAVGYDAKNRLAFSSNGESGTLTVIDAGKPGYPVAQTLTTQVSARTMAFDPATGRIYLAASEAGKKEPGAKRATPVPNSFTILVVGRE